MNVSLAAMDIVQRDAAINSGFLTEVICDAQAQVRLD